MNTAPVSQRVIDFSHYLRHAGFDIGVAEISDGMRALGHLPEPDPQLSECYLRSVFCRNAEQWQRFHDLFQAYWYPVAVSEQETEPTSAPQREQQGGRLSGIAGTSTDHFKTIDQSNSGVGAGKQNTIGKADFRFLKDPRAMREAERLAEQLARQLKKKIRRKKKIAKKGRVINIRHTLRASLASGGIPLAPRFTLQTREPPRLVILHDVSHSMTWNNPLLFRFVRGLVKVFPDTEAFVFHTRLYHVTELYREHSVTAMKKKLEAKNNLWLGGTCIAESLGTFNDDYARLMLNKKTTVLLISDGFDTDQPGQLALQLKKIKHRSEKIIWLNPMLGREAYQEDASTRAARPRTQPRFITPPARQTRLNQFKTAR